MDLPQSDNSAATLLPDQVAIARARQWLGKTFAGLTWRRFGIFCLVLVVFALSRPSVRNAVLPGSSAAAIAAAVASAYVLTWLKFTPVLLAVVAVANRGPGAGWRQVAWLGAAIVIGSTVGVALAALAWPLVLPDVQIPKIIAQSPHIVTQALRWFGLGMTDAALSAMATAFGYYLKRSADAAAALQRQEQDREESQRENAEARLQLLQAQIEPHFLFNTLASMRRLYETDPAAGKAMLHHLSRYLTASLPALRDARSTVGRELALATAYLNVQQIRMGSRLAVDVDVPPHLAGIAMPPMMLATLVENAIIHGLGPLPEGGCIRISARIEGELLRVEVFDNGRGLADDWGVGVGLANIRARLRSQFGDAAQLHLVARGEGGVTASIDLPLDSNAQALAA